MDFFSVISTPKLEGWPIFKARPVDHQKVLSRLSSFQKQLKRKGFHTSRSQTPTSDDNERLNLHLSFFHLHFSFCPRSHCTNLKQTFQIANFWIVSLIGFLGDSARLPLFWKLYSSDLHIYINNLPKCNIHNTSDANNLFRRLIVVFRVYQAKRTGSCRALLSRALGV